MNKDDVLAFIYKTDKMRNPIRKYPNKTVVFLYDEANPPIYSFQAAALRLGCKILNIRKNAEDSFEDTIRTIQHYGHAIVLRHKEEEDIRKAISISRAPIIQSGHEFLTDIYTIYKELKYRGIDMNSSVRKVLNITFLGYNRNIQALVFHLNLFPKIDCHYITDLNSPDYNTDTDVLYVSRPQKEESYCVDRTFLSQSKPTMIVMHNLPRKKEISKDIDTNPRSVYFQQSENDLYVRMAILDKLFSIRGYPTFYELFWIYMAKLASMFSF
jgi:aspartate carbamoyltransferase catalytic subunit